MPEQRQLLITGATGFVGRHLVRHALERGFAVRALVRPGSDLSPLPTHPDLEVVRGDITEPASLSGCCNGVAAVIHAACAVAATFDADRDARHRFLEVNRDGTVNLAHEALRAGVRFVHVSSTAVMGTPRSPRVDETTPCHPRAPYQVSKRQAELVLLDLHRKAGLDVVILRPCLIAGEGKVEGELLKLFRLVKRGRFPWIGRRRDIVKPILMVDDLVRVLVDAVDRGEAGEVYLLHSGGGHTLGDIIDTAGRLTGTRRTHIPVPVTAARLAAHAFAGVSRLWPGFNPPLTPERVDLFLADRQIDISKARCDLGFDPQHQDLDEMLGRSYRWYASQGLV